MPRRLQQRQRPQLPGFLRLPNLLPRPRRLPAQRPRLQRRRRHHLPGLLRLPRRLLRRVPLSARETASFCHTVPNPELSMQIARHTAWLVLLASGSVSLSQPSFHGLGGLPNGLPFSWAHELSARGNTMVGFGYLDGQRAAYWVAGQGLTAISDGPDPTYALDVSADGSVITGYSQVPLEINTY